MDHLGLESEPLHPSNRGDTLQARLPPPPDPRRLRRWDPPSGDEAVPGAGTRVLGEAAYLGAAVLRRRECRGLFVPGLPAQNWGSPCKRLPSQTPPRTRPQPPSLPPVPRAQPASRLCSCCRARDVLMRERQAGGGAPPPAPAQASLPRPPAPRPATPHPPLSPPPGALGRGGRVQPAVGDSTLPLPAAQRDQPCSSASSIPAPRRCHGNVCPAGLGRGDRERSAQGWRGGAGAVCDPGPGEQDPE